MQWTSSVSSRAASVRLRAVRTRIGLPDASSSSGTTGEPPGSSWISSRVRCVPGAVREEAALAATSAGSVPVGFCACGAAPAEGVPGPGPVMPVEVAPGMGGAGA